MIKETFIGNVYDEQKDLINKVIEVFTDETTSTIESYYVLVKDVLATNGHNMCVKGYNVSDLIVND